MPSQPGPHLPHQRQPAWILLALLVTIVVGLGSRKVALFPAVLENYPGDALWAVVVYLCVGLIRPALAPVRLACIALVIAFLVECFQLYQAPWIMAIRATTFGHLVLGNGFDPGDLVAHVIGIGLACSLDGLLAYRKSGHA